MLAPRLRRRLPCADRELAPSHRLAPRPARPPRAGRLRRSTSARVWPPRCAPPAWTRCTGRRADRRGRRDPRPAAQRRRQHDWPARRHGRTADRRDNDFAWNRQKRGLMHGCGHDGHTTMLVGAARYLATTRQFDGTRGADLPARRGGLRRRPAMIDDGLFDRFPVAVGVRHAQLAGDEARHRGHQQRRHDGRRRPTSRSSPAAAATAPTPPDGDRCWWRGHIITAMRKHRGAQRARARQRRWSACARCRPATWRLQRAARARPRWWARCALRPAVQDMPRSSIRTCATPSAAGLWSATATVRYERIYPATINTAGRGALSRATWPAAGGMVMVRT